jgi:hypothetical protein
MRLSAVKLVKWWQFALLGRKTVHYLMLMQRFKIWLNTPTYLGLHATSIQTRWRGYYCEKRLAMQKVAVVKIQAAWRASRVPTRSQVGAFEVRCLFSRPRVVIEDDDGRLTKLAPYGAEQTELSGPKIEVVDLPRLSVRQRRLLNQYMKCVLKYLGYIDQDAP